MLARPVVFLAFAVAAPLQAATLQHDLFDRPALEALKPVAGAAVKTASPPPVPPEWKPELRAIIRGGGSPMVNVEGRIVQMGQEIEGYRLVELQEREATFVKDKVRHTLVLKGVKAADAPSPVTTPAEPAPVAAKQPGPPTAAASTPEAAVASRKAVEPAPGAVKPAEQRPPEPRPFGALKTSDIVFNPARGASASERSRE